MRVSTKQQFISLQERITAAQAQYADLQRQLATGKRIEKPSDDPLASLDAMTMRSARALASQHIENARTGVENMTQAEAAMAETNTLLKRAYQLVVQGASDTTSQEAREGIADEIASMRKRLVSLANTTDGQNRYIFAGHEVDTEPFEVVAGTPPTLQYNGDAGFLELEVAPGNTLKGNLLVDAEVTAAFDALVDAEERLRGGDASGLSGITLQYLDDSLAEVRALQSESGARSLRFQESHALSQRRIDSFSQQISDREDADFTKVAVDLRMAQAAYQASLAAFSSISSLGLLEYLRN